MKSKNFISIVVLLILYSSVFAQEKLVESREVTGKISYLSNALQSVNVIIVDSDEGAKSDHQGSYSIIAKPGDYIQYSFVGYETITILVEDVTKVLNISMNIVVNQLDVAVVKGKKKDAFPDKKRTEDRKRFATSKGSFDPETAGHSIGYIDGDEINMSYNSLSEAIIGKVAGLKGYWDFDSNGVRIYKLKIRGYSSINNNRPPIWDVDGVIYEEEPRFLNFNNIKNIHVLKSLIATNKYGSLGSQGVIVIQTKDVYNMSLTSSFEKEDVSKRYTNKNFYKNDAVEFSETDQINSLIINRLKGLNNSKEAFSYYNKNFVSQANSYSEHIAVARFFNEYYKDVESAKIILNELTEKHQTNPEILKVIGFQFQEINAKVEAISIYKKVFKLRPAYAQSYRDLANAYIDNDNYKMAWRMYMSYLLQGNDVSDLAIGELIFNEMEGLYFNRKNQAGIKESFVPKNNSVKEFRNDMRIVFEWNTSEADFELEFVNPENQVFIFEHNLVLNQDLINQEKEIGYSSKEFIIGDLKNGEWLVNMKYYGNKTTNPTYLKTTVYENWGYPNQSKKVTVFNFNNEKQKVQLFVFDKSRNLMVSN